ncbi:ABC transporter ATP-binding protein [Janibacter melonis]|uniref:ABC transporter ATP-binding protein n=1 Tax=Janibacter melonis TaxID=262209 RepID=UPI00209610DD|nr:ABC transporter ATP-binding protein [Janibacter melonis]
MSIDEIRGASVVANGVAHAYGKRPALHGVDVHVQPGEVVAISGPSGAGKSTLLHALGGVIVPDAGTVRVGDHEITSLDDDARSVLRRSEIGLLLQHGQLVEELTIVENVALPLLLARRSRGEALETARSWLDRVGIADHADQLTTEVSGGQLQRAALARSLITGPRVLLADEPTGALDSRAGEMVMELVGDIASQEQMTVILVTHDARVAAYAQREIVVRDGIVDAVPAVRGQA